MARPRRILLIDDEQDILTVTRTTLEVMGDFAVVSCSSAIEALANLEKFYPDFILVDVMMPDLDGISFIRRLKELPRFSRIPVVFLTARTQPGDVEHYREEGAIDVITKPFEPEELVQRLNRLWPVPAPRNAQTSELADKLKTLQTMFVSQLPTKIEEIETLWSKVLKAGQDWPSLHQFYRRTHSLAGSGATFGFNTLSIVSRILENFLHPLMEEKQYPTDTQKRDLTVIVRQLKEAAARPEEEF